MKCKKEIVYHDEYGHEPGKARYSDTSEERWYICNPRQEKKVIWHEPEEKEELFDKLYLILKS